MKYCNKCGAPVNDEAKFCPKCGAVLSGGMNEEQKSGNFSSGDVNFRSGTNPGYRQQKQGKSMNVKKLLKTLVPIGIIAVAVIVFAVIMVNRPTTINVEDYLSIDVNGYNKYGTAVVNFDETKFADDVVAAMAKKHIVDRDIAKVVTDNHYSYEQLSSFPNLSGKVSDVCGAVTWRLEGADEDNSLTNLSNGDTVTASIACDNEKVKPYRIRLEGKKLEKEVKNLKKVGTFDAFKDIEISTDGMDGEGTLTYNLPDTEDYGLEYSADQTSELSNGDTVTITVKPLDYDDFDSDYIDEYGEIPEKTTYEVKISGLPEYVEKLSDLSDDVLADLKKEGNDQISAKVVQICTLNSVSYSGACLLTTKGNADDHNILYLAYQLNIGSSDGQTRNTYVCIAVPNVYLDTDGKLGYSVGDIGTYLGDQWTVFLSYNVLGYNSLDDLTNDLITPNIGSYNKKSTF